MPYISIGPLVRATSASSVTIWAECTRACTVMLNASPIDAAADTPPSTSSTRTVMVGGRHYALAYLDGLQPATWYTYHLSINDQKGIEPLDMIPEEQIKHQDTSPQLLCFRTMDAAETEPAAFSQLRIAYGSCRKSEEQDIDAFSAFGDWLTSNYEQREEQWPHLLLLIGDQIYADQPPAALTKKYPQLEQGARSFEDFALLYEYAWTNDSGVRQALAVVPTYLIFDDHEVTNDWNTSPTWRAAAIRKGLEQMLVDGLVAYWVYQGWGNLDRKTQSNHSPLQTIMQEAEQHGEDVLEALRAQIKEEIYGRADLHWHYTIPTTPPIFVANARTGRTAVFADSEQEIYAPARIMSQQQMDDLRTWMHAHTSGPLLLVSSVPILLPPVIGMAEYVAGKRFWQKSVAPLRRLGLLMARFQHKVALRANFDHWPLYSATWQEFIHLLDECDQDILILSGDVHFSYAMEARRTRRKRVNVYQFVCTPLQNVLTTNDRKLVEGQAAITRIPYGGLHTHVLPLYTADTKARIPHDLLFQNSLALLKVETEENGKYELQQEYLGRVGGNVEIIGKTVLDAGH